MSVYFVAAYVYMIKQKYPNITSAQIVEFIKKKL